MTAQEDLLNRYPAISDLKAIAERRMPRFAWEYLDSGTGLEIATANNRKALDSIRLVPRVVKGSIQADTSVELFGKRYAMPIGIAPVGMSGLMWPGAELYLAKTAKKFNIPYCLSTVACETIEDIGKIAGANAWFQLYIFRQWETNADLVARAQKAGFSTLVVTVDVPTPSMRERQRRIGLKMPPAITPSTFLQVGLKPHWAVETLRHGTPHFRNLVKYAKSSSLSNLSRFLKENKDVAPTWEDISRLRKMWNGALVVKGILHEEDALEAVAVGVDGIIVSNHGGRQFDGAPASITVLPQIANAVEKKAVVMVDSGITGGLDIARACALGADFAFAGRAFLHGVAGLGKKGADHAAQIFKSDLENVMHQTSSNELGDLRRLAVGYM